MVNINDNGCGCGCFLLFLLFYVVVSSLSVNYLIEFFGLHSISTVGTCVIGFIAGEVTIPVAICIFLLKAFGAM